MTAQKNHLNDVSKYELNSESHISDDNHHHISDTKLQENINRLSRYSQHTITSSMISSYVKLFIQKRLSHILSLSFIMSVFVLITHIAESSLGSSKPIISFGFKIIYMLIAVFIGMNILRLAILSKKQHSEISFLKGFLSFLLLHFIINIITIISLFLITHSLILLKIDTNTLQTATSYTILIASSFITSLVGSVLLVRFSFIIPALISDNEENFHNLSSRMKPCFKFLFFTFFSVKFICLNAIVFSHTFLSYNNIDTAIKIILFVIYHIFVYSLIGVSFKLLNKNQ